MTKKYDFKYNFSMDDNNKNGFTANGKETIREKQKLTGLTDGMLFTSIIKTTIANSDSFYRLDATLHSIGLSVPEIFCAWCLTASSLLKNPDLPDFARDICEKVVKQFDGLSDEIKQENTTIN